MGNDSRDDRWRWVWRTLAGRTRSLARVVSREPRDWASDAADGPTRRTVLQRAGAAGSLTLFPGLNQPTEGGPFRVTGSRFAQADCPEERDPPESREDALTELEAELAALEQRLAECRQQQEQASVLSQARAEAMGLDPNCIAGHGCGGRGIYLCASRYRADCMDEVTGVPVPDCSLLEALRDDLAQLLDDLRRGEAVPPPVGNRPAESEEDILRKKLDGLRQWRAALQDAIQKAFLMARMTEWAAALTGNPIAKLLAALWNLTFQLLSMELDRVNREIADKEQELSDLEACRGAGAVSRLSVSPPRPATLDHLAHPVTLTSVQTTPTQETSEYTPALVPAAVDEVRRFEPWAVDFEEPTSDLDATLQTVVTQSAYYAFAQLDLVVSQARWARARTLRRELGLSRYVDAADVWALVDAELAQLDAIAHNARAAATHLTAVVDSRPELVAAYETVVDEDLSTAAAADRYQQWWATEENRWWAEDSLALSGPQWAELSLSLQARLADMTFESPRSPSVLDEEWERDMDALATALDELATGQRELHRTLTDRWRPPPREAG